MKRLTMHTPDGACLIINADNEQDARQELMEKFKEACNRLAELEDKLENGTLIELPCKVGDTVYVLNRANKPQKMILNAPDIRCHCVDEDNLCMALCSDKKNKICAYRFMNDNSDIGKKVFLTKEDAEKVLEERNNG